MRINRMRKEQKLFNKVNGKEYVIIDVTVNDDMKFGTAKELLDDGTIGEETVRIDAENALAFRIDEDPAPYPVPEGYTIFNGQLMADGEPACEQGQYQFLNIIAKQPGALILTAKAENGKDINLVKYELTCDRFTKLREKVPECITLAGYAGDIAILAYSAIKEDIRENKKGEEEKVSVFEGAQIITVGPKRTQVYEIDHPITVNKMKVADHAGRRDKEPYFIVYYPCDATCEDHNIVKPANRQWFCLEDGEEQNLHLSGENTDVTATWCPIYNNFVFKDEDALYIEARDVCIKTPKVKELAGFDILIDITVDCKEHTITYTFANDAYKLKSIVCKETRDRGVIYTIE